eukprot:TRINITY_DN1415_c0_g1_i1.p1 TRINITY_DN1415_c0_g1~~TRINITY_DN1415_c0_g1_i1.p1  ORF type:complete len:405 (-),score=97.46 TRINITY_DN1415_c0_g1_i1:195-1409(-)
MCIRDSINAEYGETRPRNMDPPNQSPAATPRMYGWRPQLPDRRDAWFRSSDAELPPQLDLRESYSFPQVYNQGKLGSCTANSIAGAFEFNELKAGYAAKAFQPSRLFIYYNERRMEGHVGSDTGAALRDGFKSVNQAGVCAEAMWPYDITQFATKPSDACYTAATEEKALKYRRVEQNLSAIKHAMHEEGQPVCFGFIPEPNEKVLGGHAVLAVGYDDATQHVIVRNSWGAAWGQQGYFKMPYGFITDPNSASDFWIVQTISRAPAQPAQQEHWQMFPALQAEDAAHPSPGQDETAEPGLKLTGDWTAGQACAAGEAVAVTWESSGSIQSVKVLYCCNSWIGMVGGWSTAADSVANTGRWTWVLPTDTVADNRYWLRIVDTERPKVLCDSAYFSVGESWSPTSC